MEVRFKLNPSNSKDLKIIELLNGEYNGTEYIKGLLYKIATGGNVGSLVALNVVGGIPTDYNGVTEGLQDSPQNPLNDNLGNSAESEGISEEATNEFAEFF